MVVRGRGGRADLQFFSLPRGQYLCHGAGYSPGLNVVGCGVVVVGVRSICVGELNRGGSSGERVGISASFAVALRYLAGSTRQGR